MPRLPFPAALAWSCLAAAHLLSWLHPETRVVSAVLLLLMLAFGLLSAWRLRAIPRADRPPPVGLPHARGATRVGGNQGRRSRDPPRQHKKVTPLLQSARLIGGGRRRARG